MKINLKVYYKKFFYLSKGWISAIYQMHMNFKIYNQDKKKWKNFDRKYDKSKKEQLRCSLVYMKISRLKMRQSQKYDVMLISSCFLINSLIDKKFISLLIFKECKFIKI